MHWSTCYFFVSMDEYINERKFFQSLFRESNGAGTLSPVMRSAVHQSSKPLKMDLGEKTLTAKARKHIKKKNFALPGGRYPIHDAAHARNALSRVAQNGTPEEKKKVKAAVHKKYPGIGKESLHPSQKFQLIETLQGVGAKEGPIVKCVLITEGLGNRKDMNYYSSEAIQGGAALFEGKPCFLDHMAESETVERPERSVKEKCGYFKNVQSQVIDGRVGLVAELHFDLSETGKMAYEKALTAIHYKGEFPNSDMEYIGLSINANGSREKRVIQIDNEMLEVNYVTQFTDVGSIDEVTTPARGGRFLAALVESAAGAILRGKENTMKVKELKAAQPALENLLKGTELEESNRKALTTINKFLQEAMKAAEEAEEESEEESKEECNQSEESKEEEEEEDGTDGGGEGVKPGHKVTKTVTVKHDGPAADDEEDDDDKDAQESKRGYIKSLLMEAKVPKKIWNIDRLMKLSLKEAKADIAEKRALLESVKETIKEQEFVPVGNGGEALEESDNSNDLNSLFAEVAR